MRYNWGEIVLELPTVPLVTLYIGGLSLASAYTNRLPARANIHLFHLLHHLFGVFLNAVCLAALSLKSVWPGGSTFLFSTREQPEFTNFILLYLCTRAYALLDSVYLVLERRHPEVHIIHLCERIVLLLTTDFVYRKTPWVCFIVLAAPQTLLAFCRYMYAVAVWIDPLSVRRWIGKSLKLANIAHSSLLILYVIWANYFHDGMFGLFWLSLVVCMCLAWIFQFFVETTEYEDSEDTHAKYE